MRRTLFAIIVATLASSSSAIIIPSIIHDAYAHGVPSGFPFGLGSIVRLQFERFSTNTVDVDSNDGGVITITGTLKNLDTQRTVKLTPYISVQSSNPFGSFNIPLLLYPNYPIYNDPSSWYFRTESNLTTPFTINPNEEVSYQIKVYPLKAGTYHIHSFFLSDIVRNNYYLDGIAAGQTVNVSGGSSLPTIGEIAQLYLPFAIGVAAVAFLLIKAIKITKEKGASRSNRVIRGSIRMYFAVKSSFETVWLAGLLSWLVFAAYPALQPFAETRFVSLLTTIAIIAAITIGGYIATVAKSHKIQSAAAIGTAGATTIFYVLMFFVSYSSSFNVLSSSGIGYARNQFDISSLIGLAAVIVNPIVVAIMAFLIIKETNAAGKARHQVTSTTSDRK